MAAKLVEAHLRHSPANLEEVTWFSRRVHKMHLDKNIVKKLQRTHWMTLMLTSYTIAEFNQQRTATDYHLGYDNRDYENYDVPVTSSVHRYPAVRILFLLINSQTPRSSTAE
eukprot:IDg7328t1